MITNFTLNSYQELLELWRKDYEFVTFKGFEESKKSKKILLRHDIDYSLEYAYEIAKIEASIGVKSTYFLLFSSEFYNILDDVNIDLARKISELGHEVGLHYDVVVLQKNNHLDPKDLLVYQAELLGKITGEEIESIAMHNPSINGEDIFKETNFNNAYSSKYLKHGAYFSDSCAAWRNEFISRYQNNDFPNVFQFLIHPILWTNEEQHRLEKLNDFEDLMIKKIKKDIDYSRKVWINHSGVKEHDERENRG